MATDYQSRLFTYINRQVSVAPLVNFRIIFGLLMFASLIRFWYRGWISTVYIQPRFHFTYMGFGWVQPLSSTGMYVLFALIIAAALFVSIGFLYRFSAAIFFLGFTYVELLDVTTYLNHYYFISLVSFLMIWLPAHRSYSIDVWLWPRKKRTTVPAWCVGIIRFQMAVVYVFAGLAKVNSDWLLDAQPMRTWLPAKSHLPVVGQFMYETWVAYLFSWFGAVYDLFIVAFLLNRRTRVVAYLFVIIFHTATALFFPGIGMFPYVMILSSLVFFSGAFHQRLLSYLPGYKVAGAFGQAAYSFHHPRLFNYAIALYAFIQLALPMRYLLYPGHLFWNEEGFRFSWRVMLMEKSGATYFTVKTSNPPQSIEVNNAEFLTPLQEKMMSTQPDMILKYAHYLAHEYEGRGLKNPEVYAEIYVALNGQRSRLFVDTTVNLAQQPLTWGHYNWVLPWNKK